MNEKAFHTLEYDKIISLLGEHASTVAGKELCKNLKPMMSLADIREALAKSEDARFRIATLGSISFGGVKNILLSLKRVEVGSSLSAKELLEISSTLDVASRALAYGRRKEDDENSVDSLSPLFEQIDPLKTLNAELKRCIIAEDEIADDASAGLRSVRRAIKRTNDKVHTQLNSLLVSARTYLQDGVITMRDGRYCLPVRAEYKSSVPGLIHDQSGSGSTFFIEPMSVVNLNNELRELAIKEKKEIEAVLASLSSQVAEFTAQLTADYHVLTELDFIFAKGSFALTYRGSAPTFNNEHKINIKRGRHPLLSSKTVVPTNVWLGDEFDLLVITGPNTGGKTVTLKTIGLLTLMGEAGLLIPADDGSVLSVFDNVFADIGDEQSIEQSLSTFSAHMTNIVQIMKEADEHSLVLFDELGAGTDPTEGAALAMSILSKLHSRGILTVATTHYSELKLFALSTPGVENASCEFDVATLRPTYRLLIGIPGKSNAFAISQKLGLSSDIIEDAKASIGENDEAFEDVISDLEARRINLEKQEAESVRLRQENERLVKESAEKRERLEAQRDKIIAEAKEEARAILQEAKDTADKAIRAMNKAGVRVSKEAELERSSLRNALNKNGEGLAIKPKKLGKVKAEDLHVGDSVRVLSLNLDGTVSTLPDSKGRLFVQMGALRSQVNVTDLEYIEALPDEDVRVSGVGAIRSEKVSNISTEINLVGMRVDEAMPALEQYLDDAYLAKLTRVRIIHGRGTGALKSAVQTMLRKNKFIGKYYTAEYNEGGYGVTIAEFK